MTATVIHLVVNPVSGHGTAKEFVNMVVRPILESAGCTIKMSETQSVGDASRIAREISSGFTKAGGEGGEGFKVLIAGGDGTAHEYIEGIYGTEGWKKGNRCRWELALLPLGTANALYASHYPPSAAPPTFPIELQPHFNSLNETSLSKLHSLAVLLDSTKRPRRLPVSLFSRVRAGSTPTADDSIPSHVVVSTCLHANLLATAEGLRKEYPGVERFTVAAQQNAGKFYPARVRLLPTIGGSVMLYNPTSTSFEPVPETLRYPNGDVQLEDDFAYFLSSATCARLEPAFVISPLIDRISSSGISMDVTIIRPGRDPRVRQVLKDSGYGSIKEAREAGDEKALQAASEAWIPRAWEVLGKAYEEGAHVELTYGQSGEVEVRGEGEKVVEVYRCAGFEWTPLYSENKDSHLICADGSLIHLEPGQNARVTLDAKGGEEDGIFLWT